MVEKIDTGKNLPEKKFSTGAIRATVWKNKGTSKDGQETEFRTITLDRSYMDKEGNWKSTGSLRVNDLPRAALVLNKAYEFIVLKGTGLESQQEAAVM